MPIYRRESSRKGAAPLVFFKGTIDELKQVKASTISELFFPVKIGPVSLPAGLRFGKGKKINSIREKLMAEIGKNWPNYRHGKDTATFRLPMGDIVLQLRKLRSGNIAIYQLPLLLCQLLPLLLSLHSLVFQLLLIDFLM